MDLVAKTGVRNVIESTRNQPIYVRPAAPRGTLLNRTVPQNLRPTTPVSKLRVLVIDDCPANADSLVFMLSHAGYEAKAIYSADDGINIAKRFRPEMLICALSTGRQNIELTTSIRRVCTGLQGTLVFAAPETKLCGSVR